MKRIAIVGAGITGGVLARQLVHAGIGVHVIEQAGQAGGACATRWVAGEPYDLHAPHFYHTADPERWDFMRSHGAFNHYCLARAVRMSDGSLVRFPPDREACDALAPFAAGHAPADAAGFEGETIKRVGWGAYRALYRRYSRAQWSLPPDQLAPGLAGRTGRMHLDALSFPGEFQGVPIAGWTPLIDDMLKGCTARTFGVHAGPEYVARLMRNFALVLYTGCLEDLFPDDPRRLPYRGQQQVLSVEWWRQPAAFVCEAAPGRTGLLRSFCWTWIRRNQAPGTQEPALVGRSYAAAEPKLYPVPVAGAEETYLGLLERCLRRWRGRVIPCGRLGFYKYLDLDVAVRMALALAEAIKRDAWPGAPKAQLEFLVRLRGST